MLSTFRGNLALLVVFLFLAHPAIGRDLPGEFYTRHFSESDGLPSQQVFGFSQDDEGRIWVATRNGLVAFDGSRFSPLVHDGEMSGIGYSAITSDPRGRIWVVEMSRSPNGQSFRSGTLMVIHDLDRWDVKSRPDKDLSFERWPQRTGPIAATGEKATVVAVATDKGVGLWSDESWRFLGADSGLPAEPVLALVAWNDSFLVGGEWGLALVEMEKQADQITSRPVFALSADPDGSVWVVGPGWVGSFGPLGLRILHEELSLGLDIDDDSELPYLVLAPDGHGGAFVSDHSTTLQLDADGGSLEPIDLQKGRKLGGIDALYLDRDAGLWLANLRETIYLPSRRFLSMNQRHGLLEDEVSALTELSDGTVVVGHNGGLTILGADFTKSLHFGGVNTDARLTFRVMDLFPGAGGGVLIAANGLGLGELGADGKLSWHPEFTGKGLHSVLRDSRGRIWVGGPETLAIVDGQSVRHVSSTPEPLARRLIETSDGRILVMGYEVIRHGDEDGWEVFPVSPQERTYTAIASSDGRIWVGTVSGLRELVDGKLRLPAEEGLRVSRPTYLLLEDSLGRLWIGTDKYVVRWDGRTMRRFGVLDGLIGHETNRAAGLETADGIWIGTNRGVSVFQEKWDREPALPSVWIGKGESQGRALSLKEPAFLEPGQDSIDFYYGVTALVAGFGAEVSARLIGLEADWRVPEVVGRNRVRYTSLPPGEYRLEIKARSPEGPWSASVISAPIILQTPLLSRWWVRIVLLLAAIGSIYGLVRLLERQRSIRELESEVRERTTELTSRLEDLRSEVLQRRKVEADLIAARDEAETANRTTQAFLATVSHELRTPLTGVLGVADLLLRSDSDTNHPDGLRTILRSGESLLALIDDILEFSRLESGRVEFEERPFSVSSIFRDVAKTLEPAAREKGLSLQVELAKDPIEPLLGDVRRLRQILLNLGGNAIKFTEEGSVSFRAKWQGENLEIEVEDTGIGVSPAEQDRIFEPFEQVDSGLSRRYRGLGLGLAISRQLARGMGGDLTVDSQAQSGSCFRLTIPSKETEAMSEPDLGGCSSPVGLPSTISNLRVLLVEDDDSSRLVLTMMLQQLGVKPISCVNGTEAVEIASKDRFDLILMDLQMPGMDGFEATHRILSESSSTPPTIVALSAHSGASERSKCIDAGCDDLLAKPCYIEDLHDLLRRIV